MSYIVRCCNASEIVRTHRRGRELKSVVLELHKVYTNIKSNLFSMNEGSKLQLDYTIFLVLL